MNKKGLIAMGLSLIVFTSLLLVVFSLQMTRKTGPYTGQAGALQSEQLKAIVEGHKALVYLDQSAEFALQDAIVEFISKGGGDYGCGEGVWETVDEAGREKEVDDRERVKCYPNRGMFGEAFEEVFAEHLDAYLQDFPQGNFPLNNVDLFYEQKENRLEVVGFGTRDLVFPSARAASLISEDDLGKKRQDAARRSIDRDDQKCLGKTKSCGEYTTEIRCDFDPCNLDCYWEDRCRALENVIYTVKPSFRIASDYDFIEAMEHFKKVILRYQSELGGCLMQVNDYGVVQEGSDLAWCTEAIVGEQDGVEGDKTLARMVGKFSKFEVTATDSGQDYTLVFEITDDTFSHRWEGTPGTMRVRLRFWDRFRPVRYAGFAQEEDADGEKTGRLTWDRNPASDVERIRVFAKQKGDEKCSDGEVFLPFRTIEYNADEDEPYFDPVLYRLQSLENSLAPQPEQDLDFSKEVCFIIVAEDNAGSSHGLGNFGEAAFATYLFPPLAS